MICAEMMNVSDMSNDYRRAAPVQYFGMSQLSDGVGSVANSVQSTKHSRDETNNDSHAFNQTMVDGFQQTQQHLQGPQHVQDLPAERSSKRSRSNGYEAPTTIRPSVLTAMGSLVGGTQERSQGNANTFVPLRRQLSGGALDKYIGSHDSMETDANESSRPRSMSF